MRPLPAVLLDLHEELATGKLSLRRGRVAKVVDLVNGNPVSTASTPRDETLGHFLVSSGVITEDQHRDAVSRAATLGGKLGEALVAMQILSVEQLIDQLGKQARHKIVQALRWPQGAWRFDPGSEAVEGMQLRMVDVVLCGLRDTAAQDLGRLARLENMTFELTTRGQRLRLELKRTFGEPILVALAAAAPIGHIERAFGDKMRARTAIDALLMCDAVVSKSTAVGLGTVVPISRMTLAGYSAIRDKLPAELADQLREPPIQVRVDPPPEDDDELEQELDLYSTLFDEEEEDLGGNSEKGAAPLEFMDEDSGLVSEDVLNTASALREQTTRARQAIAAEHQRIQGADLYAVLLIDRDATREDVEDAYQVKTMMFERASTPGIDASTRPKVDEIRAAYMKARTVLSDPRKRSGYDRELAGGELVQGPPSLDTELTFRMAEQHMTRQQWPQAIGLLKTVLAKAPNEADYHAALGWAQWHAGKSTPEAGDAARGHLNHALSIDPDHAASHEYKGRIDASLRDDDVGAVFHLERAIDLDPMRGDALAALDELLVTRGELRRIERVLKRALFRLRGKGGTVEARAWARLARLYFEHLDSPGSGAPAAANARKLAPDDAEVARLIEGADAAGRSLSGPLRAGWREALGDTRSGVELVRTTQAAGHSDAAFLAASTMVALATADEAMQALYEEYRPRTPTLPSTPLDRNQWALLRHKDDTVELGALVELVAPAIHALSPMTLADSELDPGQRIPDADLPQAFQWLRAQLGALLGVADAPVYTRPELGSQIHVVACDPPVLIAGDDALTAPERPELVFRLARALTFLWPGRAVGSSRPGRVLKSVVLAIVREAAGNEIGKDDPLAARATEALAVLPADARTQARATALRLLSRGGGGLNLSLWARSLARTADRAGMLLCGDVPAAFGGAREMGDLDKDLIEFAYSAAHVKLRSQLGLSSG